MMKTQIKHQKQRGVAAVEFAFLIIPMLLIVFGITEFGRAMYQYNTLVKSTRDAARYLSALNNDPIYHGDAQCLAVHGNVGCSGPKLISNLDKSMVYVCDSGNCSVTHKAVETGSGVVNLVTVGIRGYQFESVVSFNIAGLSIGLPNLTFGDISTTMRQIL
jgi:Flp pilus assembly protein TadG